MTTFARRVVSDPVRSASNTWKTIVDLLAPNPSNKGRAEFLAVTGVASSLLTTEAWADAPIVVYGSGPRILIYCLYGEDAIVADNANEMPLTTDPISGDWVMSIPCETNDLDWAQDALEWSKHIFVREMKLDINDVAEMSEDNEPVTINIEALRRS